jgi:membrane protein DedA with SNARE-associated domain
MRYWPRRRPRPVDRRSPARRPARQSATAFTAGTVGYPVGRFGCYTRAAVIVWAAQSASLGYFGGIAFAGNPPAALVAAGAVGLIIMIVAAAVQRFTLRPGSSAPPGDIRGADGG